MQLVPVCNMQNAELVFVCCCWAGPGMMVLVGRSPKPKTAVRSPSPQGRDPLQPQHSQLNSQYCKTLIHLKEDESLCRQKFKVNVRSKLVVSNQKSIPFLSSLLEAIDINPPYRLNVACHRNLLQRHDGILTIQTQKQGGHSHGDKDS